MINVVKFTTGKHIKKLYFFSKCSNKWLNWQNFFNILFLDNKSHLRQTTQKIDPQPETVDKIKNSVVWKMENELYDYALAYFHTMKRRLLNASIQDASQRFMYEKIRPK